MNQKTDETETDPLAKLDEFATEVCVPEADAYKRRERTTRSQAMCYGEGVRMGFIAGFASRHYFRPGEFEIANDMLDTIRGRYPELARTLDALLEGDDGEDVASMFDEAPTEHENDEDDQA